jgi:hypothetical protein
LPQNPRLTTTQMGRLRYRRQFLYQLIYAGV